MNKEDDKPFKDRNYIADFLLEPSRRQQRFIEMAKSMATQSTYGKIKHGAVLVKGGSVLNTSFNKDKFNSLGNRFRRPDRGHATHHAEIGCIMGVNKSKTSGATVYVTRINRKGEYRLSKPCLMCHEVLKHCGVKKVIYTAGDREIRSYKL